MLTLSCPAHPRRHTNKTILESGPFSRKALPWCTNPLINPFLHKLLEQQLAYPRTPPFPLSVSMKLLMPSPQWEKWDPRATIDPVVSKCKLLYKIKKYYIRNLKCYILSRIKIDYANLYSEEGNSLELTCYSVKIEIHLTYWIVLVIFYLLFFTFVFFFVTNIIRYNKR